ncbi:hypothetical protein M885DRAFT_434593 [Pelagophyceae sp. CCMP2097]|nr:hypothetical protein M885DRAFT_434593 [Pelagophyceae sp. CCMP2097]
MKSLYQTSCTHQAQQVLNPKPRPRSRTARRRSRPRRARRAPRRPPSPRRRRRRGARRRGAGFGEWRAAGGRRCRGTTARLPRTTGPRPRRWRIACPNCFAPRDILGRPRAGTTARRSCG